MIYERFGAWLIEYNPKPIPSRLYDYDVTHNDFDGENGDFFFNCESVEEAKKEIQIRRALF